MAAVSDAAASSLSAQSSSAPSAASSSTMVTTAPPPPAPAAPNTIFVKVERLRKLQRATTSTPTVRRGEDGTFGLGLTEDNQITQFHHQENAGVLRIGDQVRAVNDTPLVRERLASLLQRKFADHETVQLHISRSTGADGQRKGGELFAALELRDAAGKELDEWLSELWTMRSDNATWGTFWTLPIMPGVRSAWLGIHESKIFTEPLIGWLELELANLPAETLDTRWYSLRPENAKPYEERDIEGEVLVTVRKFASSISISPDGYDFSDDSSDELDPSVPIDHMTAPMQPIPEPSHDELGGEPLL